MVKSYQATKRTRGAKIKEGIQQWFAVLPFIAAGLILMGLFTIYPLVRNLQISFSDYNVISNSMGDFLGLRNYKEMFLDSEWLRSLRNTLLYTLVTVPGQMFLGLLMAVLVNNISKGKTVFKVILYLPVITSWVVASLAFRYIFAAGKGGLFNYILMQLHVVSSPVSWLQNEWTANIVLWIFGIWKGMGWTMVIYLAALQSIPKALFEAASIDGAGSVAKFFRITIPMVKNTTLYLLTVLTIGAFSAYIHVMMITKGGPLGRTDELMSYMYDTAFTKYNFSYSAAQAVVIGIIVFIISFIQRKISKETVN